MPRFIVYNAAGQLVADTWSSYSWFGSPTKLTRPTFTIPADGVYYARVLNPDDWSGYLVPFAYHFRLDVGRDVQLEPNDFNFANNTLGGANSLVFAAGEPGHRVASVAGSMYSQETLDYYRLGRLDPGNQVTVTVGRFR